MNRLISKECIDRLLHDHRNELGVMLAGLPCDSCTIRPGGMLRSFGWKDNDEDVQSFDVLKFWCAVIMHLRLQCLATSSVDDLDLLAPSEVPYLEAIDATHRAQEALIWDRYQTPTGGGSTSTSAGVSSCLRSSRFQADWMRAYETTIHKYVYLLRWLSEPASERARLTPLMEQAVLPMNENSVRLLGLEETFTVFPCVPVIGSESLGSE